jgi:outer membrane protein insertion porin family
MSARCIVTLALVVVGPAFARAQTAAPDDPLPPKHAGTGSFSIGVGYGVDDHFILRAALVQPNLLGTGDLLALDASLSERRQLAQLRFAHRHLWGTDATLGLQVYADRRVLPGLARDAAGVATTIAQPLGDHVTLVDTFRVEHVTVEQDAPSVLARGGLVDSSWHGGIVASLRSAIGYSTLDAPILPRHGTAVGAALESAGPWFGSSLELARASAWASTNQTLGPFIVHASGSLHAVSAGAPPSERLYLDGSSDLRGYAPGAIAPLGGTLAGFGHLELEVPVVRRVGLSVEVFGDVGEFADERGIAGFGYSLGFGIVWRSPLGPLRFDWAFPLVGPPRFVFGIGSGLARTW